MHLLGIHPVFIGKEFCYDTERMEKKRRPEQIGMFQPGAEEEPERSDVRDHTAEKLKEEGHEPAKIYVNPNDATIAKRKVREHYMGKIRGILKMEDKPGKLRKEKN